MGGTGFEITATRMDGADGSGIKLYTDVSALVVDNIHSLAGRGRAVAAVMANYDVSYGAEMNEKTPLHFGFYDGGGGCMLSMDLLTHWFSLVLASLRATPPRKKVSPLLAWAESLGWRLPPPERSIEDEMADWAKHEVYFELRGHYYGASMHEGRPSLSYDDHEGHLTWGTLEPSERAMVEELLAKRVCACHVCRAFAAGKRAKGPYFKPKPNPLAGTVSRKKDFRFSDEPTMRALPPEVETAKQLRELSLDKMPLAELPAWLAERKLERLSLYDTLVTRLPRLPPTMVSLTLWRTPIASLEGLELPALTYLTVGLCAASAIDSLDLRGLPSLTSLRIESVPIEELPRGIESSKIDWLSLTGTKLTDVRLLCIASLKNLTLEGAPLAELPDAIADCTSLAWLNLGATSLRTLPESFVRLSNLKTLFLDRTRLGPWRTWIEHIPKTLAKLYAPVSVLPASDHAAAARFLPNTSIESR